MSATRRRRRGRVAAVTVAIVTAAAAALVVSQLGHRSSQSALTPSLLSEGRWQRLPAVPVAAGADLDGSQLASVGGRVFVSVVNRAATASAPSLAAIYELGDDGWRGPVGGGPLRVNRGARVELTGGDRVCVSAPDGRSVFSRCLLGGRWAPTRAHVFSTTFPEPVVTFGGATVVSGRLLLGRAALQGARTTQGGVAVTGRLSNTFLIGGGGAWRSVGGDLEPGSAQGTQRPFLTAYRGRTCAAYDHVFSRATASPETRVRCIGKSERWEDVGVPPLINTDPHGRSAINTDGIAAVGDDLYVGVDNFGVPDVRWTVHRWNGRAWSVLPSTSEAGWNDQGTLYALDGELLAVVFGQRSRADGLETRLRVLTLRDGRWRQVGAPLLRRGRFTAPLYYGLTASEGRLYAMATVPTRRRAYDVTVQVLR